MKMLHSSRILAFVAALTVMGWSGAAFADDHHDAWSHDHNGYWDDHGSHHAYIMHDHHHGYWRNGDNGARVFIKID